MTEQSLYQSEIALPGVCIGRETSVLDGQAPSASFAWTHLRDLVGIARYTCIALYNI